MTDINNNKGYHSPNESNESCEKKNYPEASSFDELEINPLILRGIYAMGFEYPSAIQRLAIRPMLDKHDLIAQAQSGTGKTATFLIGALQKVDNQLKKPQVIVLCPNRELAQQIYYNLEGLNQYFKIQIALIMGGNVNTGTE